VKNVAITNQTYLTTERVELTFDMPLAEIVLIFYDRLKTVSKGYASFDYTDGMRTST
jgi:GTP-binding protein LepA